MPPHANPPAAANAVDLVGAFETARDPHGPRIAERALREILDAIVQDAQRAWPELAVDARTFVQWIAARSPRTNPSMVLLDLHVADLYLACACAHGDPRAVAAFDARYLAAIDTALAHMRLSSVRIDDVKQSLRVDLLVPRPPPNAQPPRIAEYTGRGPLAGWLRVCAVRVALKLLRKDKRHVPTPDDAMQSAFAPEQDAELAHLRADHQAAFAEALRDAMQTLPSRDQNLLRIHYLDGLSLDEVANVYHVHRATAARWLARARDVLFRGTRKALLARLRISESECASLIRLAQSRFDMTLRRIFA